MQSRIVLISDDADFFEYIYPKLNLRKSDELFKFKFDEVPEKIHLLSASVLIINSENSAQKTLELLRLVRGLPAIIFGFNENEELRINACKLGALGFLTPFTNDDEFWALIVTGLNIASLQMKTLQYREMLVKNNLILKNNEVFIDYATILDEELEKINTTSRKAVLVAISPNDKSKFLLQSNQIETIILNHVRKNDILMNYATNKYFLLLFDTDIEAAKKRWEIIRASIPENIYAGFANALGKVRQQLINEVLNRLHESINYAKDNNETKTTEVKNFKTYRQDFNKNLEKIISPVLYMTQQKYNTQLFGMTIEQTTGDGFGSLKIQGRNAAASFSITTAGFSKINIDISYETSKKITPRRISLEPKEFEAGLLQDLLEHFIEEFRKEICDDNS